MNTVEEVMGPLRARFYAAWSHLGAHDGLAFEELLVCYGEPHRAYHNGEHIAECLAWFARVVDLAQHPAEVTLGLFFHDLVYDPSRTDNEARSAARFDSLAMAAGLAAASRARVRELIVGTAEHDCAWGDGALLCDIDLAILGAPKARYARYEADVRREYSHVDEPLFRLGRAHVLRSLLARISIYRTERLSSLLETQARDNLRHALAAFDADPAK